MNNSIQIREANRQDYDAIYRLLASAFETEAEAKLVEALRKADAIVVSLVAEDSDNIVGHILFSEVSLSGNEDLNIIGLAPVAVLPPFQYKGIGQALIEAGLKACTDKGYESVVVLGHPDYYPRFGFQPSTEFGFRSVYEVPENMFMALELRQNSLAKAAGVVSYHAAFNAV